MDRGGWWATVHDGVTKSDVTEHAHNRFDVVLVSVVQQCESAVSVHVSLCYHFLEPLGLGDLCINPRLSSSMYFTGRISAVLSS